MKKVTYEFEVPDFCPEQCKAFSPFDYRGGRLGCLNDTKCQQLYQHLKEMEEKRRDEGITPYAGEGDVGPCTGMTDAVLGFAHALEKAAEDAQETEAEHGGA